MRSSSRLLGAIAIAIAVATATTAHAQALTAPQPSPPAKVQQTVGLTDISVSYARPAVAGRPIWGALVPYGEVWRTGANENTTITFSTDVKVAGKPLRAGTYGLHTIPTAKDWTIIFTTTTTAWGSYTYDAKEDALRVTATPRQSPVHEERLAIRFDDPSTTRATLVIAWDKLVVPVAIEVDTKKVTMARMRAELRGVAGFSNGPWAQAAAYWLDNGGPLDEALKLVDRSIAMTPTYGNLTTRAKILEKQGNAAGAREARAKAEPLATEQEMNQIGYFLVNDKKLDEAIGVFRAVVARWPQSWNAHDSLAEALATKGDKAGAIASYEQALSLAKDAAQKKRISATLAKLKK